MTTPTPAVEPELQLAEKLAELLDESQKDAGELEYKDFDFKAEALEEGEFEGFASIFGNVDSQGDVVEPGFFKKTLRESKGIVPILWQHNRTEPIGVSLELEETSKGLDARGKLVLEVQRAKEAHALLREKAIKGLSIGYTVTRDEVDRTTGIRRLKEGKLHEFSLVTFPANARATVRRVKAADIDELAELMSELKSNHPTRFEALLEKVAPELSTRPTRDAADLRQAPAIKATLGDFQDIFKTKNGDQ